MIKNLRKWCWPNYQLANELHKQIIRNFKRREVYSSLRDNIWGVDLADIQSLSKYNNGIKYLLCVIDLFNKYAWVVPLKDKRWISIVKAFQKTISEGGTAESKGGCKPNKMWVDQSGEFYNKLFKRFLEISNIEMYSTYTTKENSLLPRDLLERWKTKFLSPWQLFQRMFIFMC